MADGGGWAVVAGGSGGIGSAVVRQLAADGFDVLFTYRTNEAAATRLTDDLRDGPTRVEAVQVDLTEPAAAAGLFDRFADSEDLAAVVYAAGPYFRMDYIARTTPAELAAQLQSDTLACFHLLQPALPHLRARPGALVAVSTPAVQRYPKRDFLSSVPKAAIEALVRGIAAEEGRFGVRANCVGVGMIEAGLWDDLNANGDYTPEVLDLVRAQIPLGHFGRAEDVAHAVAFLLSERAAFVTGQTLYVDGGYTV